MQLSKDFIRDYWPPYNTEKKKIYINTMEEDKHCIDGELNQYFASSVQQRLIHNMPLCTHRNTS
jgi:hypothetical protein